MDFNRIKTFLALALGLGSLGLAGGCGDDEDNADDSDYSDPPVEGAEQGEGDGDSGDGDGDGDGDSGEGDSGDGEGDGDSGEGDGEGEGDDDDDGDADDEGDDDGDGIPNAQDNCPDMPNPKQLDFNGSGLGNVCDPLVFTTGGGTLQTTAKASAGQGSCDIPLGLGVLGGEVRILLDDDAAVARVEFVTVALADVPKQACKLVIIPIIAVIDATLEIKQFKIANGGAPYPTSLAHNLADHEQGEVKGTQNPAHPIRVTGTLSAATGPNNPPTQSALDFPGQTPPAAVLVANAGGDLELVFNDASFLMLDEDIESEDLPMTVNLKMTGLVGKLSMTP